MRFSAFFSLCLMLMVAAGLGVLWADNEVDRPGPLAQTTVVVVPKGEGLADLASRLEREGIISDSRLFMAAQYWRRWSGEAKQHQIKAGEFEVRKNASLRQVLDTLIEGRSILYKVTVAEGLTSQQIVERIKADPNLTGELTEVPPEGSLLPDTYRFARGTTRAELIERMQAESKKFWVKAWESRQPDLPVKSMEEALVLASIVEKETGRADERERVAAVFVNRLRKGMRLQSDPTIIYGIVGGQGSLGRGILRSEIDQKTAYNTYQIDGLPPGPICNPGRASIEATLNPAKTNDLFFVADGTGGHTFTTNLKDHNTAVANWRRVEREQRELKAQRPAGPQGKGAEPPKAEPPAEEAPAVPIPVRKPKKQ